MSPDHPNRILDVLLDHIGPAREPVEEVQVGAYWTLVTSRHSGLATTLRDRDPQHGDSCGSVPGAGELAGMPAGELAAYVRSDHPVARSIGMATLNSLLELDESRCVQKGAFDLLAERGKGRDLAVIGHFPFISKLRDLARNLWVLEQRPRPGDLAAEEAERILPRCEVVCITGTSLMNGSLGGLLTHCRDAFVILTGPSSPLTPLLFEYGIDAICGSRVGDPASLRPYIAQGASFRQMHTHGVRLLTLTAKPPGPGRHPSP